MINEGLQTALIVAVSGACFWGGIGAERRSSRVRILAALAGTGMAVLGGAGNFDPLRHVLGAWFSPLGGAPVVACWGALAVFGTVWGRKRVSVSRPTLALAVAFPCLILGILAFRPFYWRYFGAALRKNFPDTRGVLQQSVGITCGPSSAAMLLSCYGIRASEGIMAELARTNPIFGTNIYALGAAVDEVAHSYRRRAHAEALTMDRAARLHRPFVAFIDRPGIGGHAILVQRITSDAVWVVDPLEGAEDKLSRPAFEEQWRGEAVWLE
jgi:hypothetical protein